MFCILEYIWIDSTILNLRSKSKTLDFIPNDINQIPQWNFDGSSTGQAEGDDSEIILKPVEIFSDPFRGKPHLLVLCACYHHDMTPHSTNNYEYANNTFLQKLDEKPWYGLEQEYVLFQNNGDAKLPIGWTHNGSPYPQGPYYCGVGSDKMFGRNIAEEHYIKCLEAGIKVSGINAEVLPGQWEFQIGPCVGIDAANHLWMARYIMHRICEKYNVLFNIQPKPVKGDWNGSGCHINFSTKNMRKCDNGLSYIYEAINKLEKKHSEHMLVYGANNHERLTGLHETSSIYDFTWGIANRGKSIRIGRETVENNKGYFEDRRPAANIDPYLATAKLFETICLQ
jgi:glutamine synthetase